MVTVHEGRLPVGCMLGYVMDGNTRATQSHVAAAMSTHDRRIGLVSGPTANQSERSIVRFSSLHRRTSRRGYFEIRHALLPFP